MNKQARNCFQFVRKIKISWLNAFSLNRGLKQSFYFKILQLLEQRDHMTVLPAISSQQENTMKVADHLKFCNQKSEGARWHLSIGCSLRSLWSPSEVFSMLTSQVPAVMAHMPLTQSGLHNELHFFCFRGILTKMLPIPFLHNKIFAPAMPQLLCEIWHSFCQVLPDYSLTTLITAY